MAPMGIGSQSGQSLRITQSGAEETLWNVSSQGRDRDLEIGIRITPFSHSCIRGKELPIGGSTVKKTPMNFKWP